MRTRLVGALVISGMMVSLAACGERGERADASICTPFAAPAAPADPTAVAPVAGPLAGEAAVLDDCLHRWAYRLARAEDDDADLVASATIAACAPTLASWNQTSLTQSPATAVTGGDTAVSLVTGDTATTVSDRYDMAQRKALFYVVQARAGHCALPPKTPTAK